MTAPADPRRAFRRGLAAGLPFVLVIVPFALLFGVIGTEAGLHVSQTMGFSILVVAGAAQVAAVQMMTESAPTLVVLATALAINLRMAMYSAALAPHLGAATLWQRALVSFFLVDQAFAASSVEYERAPRAPLAEKLAFFLGTIVPVAPLWYAFTWIGATLGAGIPPEFGLDFAVPITFIAIIAPMLRSAAHVGAALVSVVAALGLVWMPYGTGLLVAGVLAMVAGALFETMAEARKRRAAPDEEGPRP